jgi:hypothetical protein
MRRKFLTIVALVSLCVATLAITINTGSAQLPQRGGFELPGRLLTPPRRLEPLDPIASTACAMQPERDRAKLATTRSAFRVTSDAVPLTRFRQESKPEVSAEKGTLANATTQPSSYTPRETIALIDPTNFGDRYLKDINGNPALLDPIVVLHETVGSADSAIGLFRTPHPRDDDQASYHTLIRLDGTVVYLVPPDKRAYGAGNSAFNGANGLELVKTNPALSGSVNNFAYHISLETPWDGNNNGYSHSGYTQSQYQSLAWLVAKTNVPDDRITTHKAVDRSGSRIDPRSFNYFKFQQLLKTYPKTNEIAIRCTEPLEAPQS